MNKIKKIALIVITIIFTCGTLIGCNIDLDEMMMGSGNNVEKKLTEDNKNEIKKILNEDLYKEILDNEFRVVTNVYGYNDPTSENFGKTESTMYLTSNTFPEEYKDLVNPDNCKIIPNGTRGLIEKNYFVGQRVPVFYNKSEGLKRGNYAYILQESAKLKPINDTVSLINFAKTEKIIASDKEKKEWNIGKGGVKIYDVTIYTFLDNTFFDQLQQWSVDAEYTIVYDFEQEKISKYFLKNRNYEEDVDIELTGWKVYDQSQQQNTSPNTDSNLNNNETHSDNQQSYSDSDLIKVNPNYKNHISYDDEDEDYEEETDEEDKGEYIFPNSDASYLSKSDVKGMTKSQINLAKNELYARHGRMFQREDLQEYFDGCSWYTPRYSPEEWDEYGDSYFFNEYEIANRNLLNKQEKKK